MSDLSLPTAGFIPAPVSAARIGGARGFAPARWVLVHLAQFADFGIISVAALLAFCEVSPRFAHMAMLNVLGALLLSALLKYSFFGRKLYAANALLNAGQTIWKLAPRWAATLGTIALLASVDRPLNIYALDWLAAYFAGAAAFAAERSAIAWLFRRGIDRGRTTQTVAILGANPLSEQLVSQFEGNRQGIKFVGVFDDRNREDTGGFRNVPKLGGLDDLIEYARVERVDFVVITLPVSATERLGFVRQRFRQLPLNVRILASPMGLEQPATARLNGLDLPGVQLLTVQNRPISEPVLWLKSAADRIGAGIGLLLLSPVLLACAAGILASSRGPVFFRQKRIGYKGRMFDIIKFRTMHATARAHTHLTQRNDPRIFAFGGILRKLSLDELPQLFNVLKGDMSLIGPRPHMPEARAAGELYFEAVREYADRHRVMPGITGWAQVNGWRGPTETREQLAGRVEYDLYYIENWSLALDFLILVRTLLAGFFGKNAF